MNDRSNGISGELGVGLTTDLPVPTGIFTPQVEGRSRAARGRGAIPPRDSIAVRATSVPDSPVWSRRRFAGEVKHDET